MFVCGADIKLKTKYLYIGSARRVARDAGMDVRTRFGSVPVGS